MGSNLSSHSRKRTHSECEEDGDKGETNEADDGVVDVVKRSSYHAGFVSLPAKKKLKGTCDYIYQRLFLDGEESDVTISALGKEWKLHRIYLCQSEYFQSMFNGPWKEARQDHIVLEIPDENIDVDALGSAFGSLYCDEVVITPVKAVPLLAAANWLHLEGLCQQCAEAMIETIHRETVCVYHTAAVQYCESLLERKCVEWLERRLTSETSVSLLKDISAELMAQVVGSEGLFVMQIEVDVYNLLKVWAYVQLHPDCTGSWKDVRAQSTVFFTTRASNEPFLESEEGQKFVFAFSTVRLQHVVNDIRSIQLLDGDNIIPQEWLHPVYKLQWSHMLAMSQNRDSGPSVDKFGKDALRCGRVLERSSPYCWRWTGFSYGIDIIMTYSPRTRAISLRRNTYTHPVSGTVCLHHQRTLVVHVAAASFNTNGCATFFKEAILHLTLDPDEETTVLQLDRSVAFPLSVSVHMALVSPLEV